MQSERWKQVEDTFHAALERPPQQRSAYLDAACAHDPDLRREVESLLEAEPHGEFLMAQPPGGVTLASLDLEQSSLTGRALNHYRLGELIGTGGMAEVYRARDTRLERDAAIKILHDARFLDRQHLEPMYREARVLASLNHPNIASVYGIEEADDLCGIALELVEGESLSERLKRGPFPVEQTLDIARQLVAGLQAAHAKGIIHRDLKPANIKLTPGGTVKIIDFGLAKLLRSLESGNNETGFSTKGLVVGTVAYMSPEQARGRPIDTRTDIWAFGCVLYELLLGKSAFQGETPTDTIVRIATEEPDWTAFSKLPRGTATVLERVIRKCLQKAPEHRYQAVGEIAEELALKQGNGNHRQQPLRNERANEDDFALPGRFSHPLFLFAQVGYMALYAAALIKLNEIPEILATDFGIPEVVGIPGTIILAMCGIAVRLYLISAVGWKHPAAGRKFILLFPIVLVLDGIWAASPLLLARHIAYGPALVCVALLAYVPFAERTLIRSIYTGQRS